MKNKVIIFLAICSVLTAATFTACGTKKSESDKSTTDVNNVGISSTSKEKYSSYTYYNENGDLVEVVEEIGEIDERDVLNPVFQQFSFDIKDALKDKETIVAYVDGEPIYKYTLLLDKALNDYTTRFNIGVKSTKTDWEKSENADQFKSLDDCLKTLIQRKAMVFEAKSENITISEETVIKVVESDQNRERNTDKDLYNFICAAYGSEKEMSDIFQTPATREVEYEKQYIDKHISIDPTTDYDEYIKAISALKEKAVQKHEVKIVT